MLKKGRILIVLLCMLCLLTVTGSKASPDIRGIRNVIGRIEQGSTAMMGNIFLLPDDCSGFELLVRSDTTDVFPDEIVPDMLKAYADDQNGMIRCPLEEETTRLIMENAYAVSIAPDGSILWISYLTSRPIMFVQRNKTLLMMTQSSDRGVPDTDGSLKNALAYKLNISSDPGEGEVCWSPDSRYLFFNDTERWFGYRMALDDPYLLDTQTGEIFLIDNGGSPKILSQGMFRCVLNGSFSMDGKSFYWYSRTYAPDLPPAHFLMRYDLESGTQETVCELKGDMEDFCEVKENCWFLLEAAEDGKNLVRMSVLSDGIERTEERLSFTWKSCRFLPAVRGKVLLAAEPLPSGGTYLLPLNWDEPAEASSWRKISGIHDGRLQEITMDAIEAELREARRNNNTVTGSANIGTANIKHAAAIIGTTNLLLTVYIREPVPDSWGGGYDDFNGQIILNTDNLKLFPIQTAWAQDGLRDQFIDGTCFLIEGYGQDALGLFCADTLPEVTFLKGETYVSPCGSFMCRNESDPLILSSVTLKNTECSAEIIAGEDGYKIHFHIKDYPEPETIRRSYSVPEILTADRWKEVTAAMNKKDQKKLSGLYTKITPEKLTDQENRDEILASYPVAAAETIYILMDNIKEANLEKAEAMLKDSGYTAEDYGRDMELAAVPRERNVVAVKNGESETYPVRFIFSASDSTLFPGNSRVQELAGLGDRIGSDIMANRCSDEPLPSETVICEKYDMGSVDFYVTVDHSEETEDALELSMTVVPDPFTVR